MENTVSTKRLSIVTWHENGAWCAQAFWIRKSGDLEPLAEVRGLDTEWQAVAEACDVGAKRLDSLLGLSPMRG